MPINCNELERQIEACAKRGDKSLLRIALELEEEKREAVKRHPSPDSIPCARLAVWFWDFFHGSDGKDYIKCSWGKHLQGLSSDRKPQVIWERAWASIGEEAGECKPSNYLSKCWIFYTPENSEYLTKKGKRKGESSKKFRECLQNCLIKAKATYQDSGEVLIAGEDSEASEWMQRLLAHDTIERKEFMLMVRWLATGSIPEELQASQGETSWATLHQACLALVGNGGYVDWYVRLREGKAAEFGVGFDRFPAYDNSSECRQYSIDNVDGIIDPGVAAWYCPVPLDRGVAVNYCGHKWTTTAGKKDSALFPLAEVPYGIFIRYKTDGNDERSTWWREADKWWLPNSSPPIMDCHHQEILVCARNAEDMAAIIVQYDETAGFKVEITHEKLGKRFVDVQGREQTYPIRIYSVTARPCDKSIRIPLKFYHQGKEFCAITLCGGKSERQHLESFRLNNSANPDLTPMESGFFLRWRGIGVETATFIAGFDKIPDKGGNVSIDGKSKELFPPFCSHELTIGVPHTIRFSGLEDEDGSITSSARCPCGIYEPYRVSAKDARKDWWKAISEGEGVSHRTRRVLVVCETPEDILEAFTRSGFVGVTVRATSVSFPSARRSYQFYCVEFESRPSQETIVEVGGGRHAFSAFRPALIVAGNQPDNVQSEEVDLVFGRAEVRVENVEGLDSCEWEVNGTASPSSPDTRLVLGATDERMLNCRVRCTPHAGSGTLSPISKNIMVLPESLLPSLTWNAPPPREWHVELRPTERALELRVKGWEEVAIQSPTGECITVLRTTTAPFWWFESSRQFHDPSPKKCRSFSTMEAIDATRICFPGNTTPFELAVQNRLIQNIPEPNADGIIKIALSSLFGGDSHFVFGKTGDEQVLTLNGEDVCRIRVTPREPGFCRDANDVLGVFLPARISSGIDRYRIVMFRDSLTADELLAPPETLLEISWGEQADTFFPLDANIEVYCREHPRGEIFAILVPEVKWNSYLFSLFTPKDSLSATSVVNPSLPMSIVRREPHDYDEDEVEAAKILRTAWAETIESLTPSHPLRQSRLWLLRVDRKLDYHACSAYWECAKGNPDMWCEALWTLLCSGYNFLFEKEWIGQTTQDLVNAVVKYRGKTRESPQIRRDVTAKIMQTGGEGLWPLLDLSLDKPPSPSLWWNNLAPLRIVGTKNDEVRFVERFDSLGHPVYGDFAQKRCAEGEFIFSDDGLITQPQSFLNWVLPDYPPEDTELFKIVQRQNRAWDNLLIHAQTQLVAFKASWKKDFVRALIRAINPVQNDQALISLLGLIVAIPMYVQRHQEPWPVHWRKSQNSAALNAVKLLYQWSYKLTYGERKPEPWKRFAQTAMKFYTLMHWLFKPSA